MRVVRIVEHPAWIRLTDWWRGLSRREQWLVGTLGGLLAVTLLVYGIVRPIQAVRAQAIADIRTYETLSARIRAAGTLGPQVPQRTGPPADVLRQSAASFALTPQVDATPDGIRATLPDAPYDTVMNWMADVARTTGLTATRVDLQRTATASHVAATIEYRP